jgi:hypothetical protein
LIEHDEDNVDMMYLKLDDEHQDKIIQNPNEDKHHNHKKILQTIFIKTYFKYFKLNKPEKKVNPY